MANTLLLCFEFQVPYASCFGRYLSRSHPSFSAVHPHTCPVFGSGALQIRCPRSSIQTLARSSSAIVGTCKCRFLVTPLSDDSTAPLQCRRAAYPDVLSLTLTILALRHDNRVPREMPRKDDLRRRHLVFLRQLFDQRIFAHRGIPCKR